jgi:hypothetical protein
MLIPIILASISANAQNPSLKTDMGFIASEGIYGEVDPGKSNTHEILIDKAGQATISLNWKEGDLETKLIDPEGNTVDTSSTSNGYSVKFRAMEYSSKNIMGFYILSDDYPPGIWTLEISLDDSALRKTDYSIGLFYEEPELTTETFTNKKRPRTNESMTVTTVLQRKTTPVLDASVQATITQLGKTIESMPMMIPWQMTAVTPPNLSSPPSRDNIRLK